MDFRTGTARTLISHFPKIVLHVSRENVVFWHTNSKPDLLGFKVWLEATIRITLEVCDIQSVRAEAVDFGEKIPTVIDGFFLEVVAERPIAQHLEESVVVGIFAHIIQIIVLATSTYTLLRICNPTILSFF
jgi:hypothetical protein